MKILIIRTFPDVLRIDSYNVQEVGLAKALVLRGHCCDIVLFHGADKDQTEVYSFDKDEKEYSFNIYWLRGYSFFKNGFMPGVKKLIPHYDVIQVHEYDQIMSWKLYTKPKKPTVLYHGPYYHPYARGYNLKCKIFDRFFLPRRRYQHVMAMTKSELAMEFLKKKGFESVVPVGVGINVDNFGEIPKAVRSNENQSDTFQILYVGKIEERRNVYFLVDVFRRLLKEHEGLQLLLIGDGDKEYKEEFLKNIEDEIKHGAIIYRQSLSQNELSRIYAGANLFLFTSNYDIFGMVLLEAMYYGLPVISTLNGGASMLIQDGENGYVVNDFDLEQWTQRIDVLIRDKDKREKMGKAARRTVEENFTWESIAGKFEAVYRKAINSFDSDHVYPKHL